MKYLEGIVITTSIITMTILSWLTISGKSILVKDLSRENLDDFYDGLPYRYNSITDLVFQEGQVKQAFLEKLHLKHRLFYKVFTLSIPTSSLPILECLEIDGILGGMLSTYLHDLDREMLEGKGDVCIGSNSMLVWQALIEQSEFSFVFRASRSSYSRTSSYMRNIGFKERTLCSMRCFFNGVDNGARFADVMQELISAIEKTSNLYSFKDERFRAAKVQQAIIAKKFFNF